jgi:maleate cis-trans isomerase
MRCDVVPYTFYRHAPAGCMIDIVHVPVESYRPMSGVDFARQTAAMLPDRPAEVVVLGGSAFSMANSYPRLREELAVVSAEIGRPVVSNLLAVVEEMRRAGVASVVACHRLAGVGERVLIDFLESAGITCTDVISTPTSLASNMSTSVASGARMAAELVERATTSDTGGDAVLLLGGSWLVDDAVTVARSAGVALYNNVLAVPRMMRVGVREVASW